MKNETLIEDACDELTYASSILNLIINNDIAADSDLFNTLESIIENIKRAKKGICSVNVENKPVSISPFEIIGGESPEAILGSATNTLKIAENLTVAIDSGKIKSADTDIVNLIQSVRLILEVAYEKVSAEG